MGSVCKIEACQTTVELCVVILLTSRQVCFWQGPCSLWKTLTSVYFKQTSGIMAMIHTYLSFANNSSRLCCYWRVVGIQSLAGQLIRRKNRGWATLSLWSCKEFHGTWGRLFPVQAARFSHPFRSKGMEQQSKDHLIHGVFNAAVH